MIHGIERFFKCLSVICRSPLEKCLFKSFTHLHFFVVVVIAEFKEFFTAQHWWLTPVIVATQEAEIRRIVVQSQPRQIVLRPCLEKKPTEKGCWSGSRCRPQVQSPVLKKTIYVRRVRPSFPTQSPNIHCARNWGFNSEQILKSFALQSSHFKRIHEVTCKLKDEE
jgi:hypothetical protein